MSHFNPPLDDPIPPFVTERSSQAAHLLHCLERLALAIADSGEPWTPAMAEAYEEGVKGLPHIKLRKFYSCIYCEEHRVSQNGLGTDIECCGEVGHVELFYELPERDLSV